MKECCKPVRTLESKFFSEFCDKVTCNLMVTEEGGLRSACSESRPVTSCDKARLVPRRHRTGAGSRNAWHVAAMANALASGEHPNRKGDSPNLEAPLLQLSAHLIGAVPACCGVPPRHAAPHTRHHGTLTAHRGWPGILHFVKKQK